MIQRLFFDGIGIGGNRFAVGMGVESALQVLPHAAAAEFGRFDPAVVIAEKAMNFLVFELFIKHGLAHG
jgi:hypothetical protein